MSVPPDTAVSPQPTVRDVNLAADPIKIKIIDIGPTPGPLSIWRQLYVLAGLDPLTAGLIQEAGNTYNLPGLNTRVNSTTDWIVKAVREPDFIDFGAFSEQGQEGSWELLGGIVASSATTDNARNLHFRPLLGGTGGIGASLYGTLGDSTLTRNLTVLGSQFNTRADSTFGDFNGELALLPWDGFKVIGSGTGEHPAGTLPPAATLIDTDRDTTFNLGSLTGAAEITVTLDGGAGLCLGSAKASCGGNTAFLEVGAPVEGGLTLANRNIISGDFSTNRVVSTLGNGQFSVTGAVGGTFSIGGLDIGRPIPIDIQIPRASSMLSSSTFRQQPSVKDSFKATPRKLGSDNESGGKHRAPLRDAVDNIKAAVNDAVSGKHAKPNTED